MLDWKILGVSVVALLIISTVLLGGFGVRNFLSDVIDRINSWLRGSPFGGFFSEPTPEKNTAIDIVLYPHYMSIKPDSIININISPLNLVDFNGEISLDFENKTLLLSEENSPLRINARLDYLIITNLEIKSLIIDNMKLDIKPDITTNNGSIEISQFTGMGLVNREGIELIGNVSKLKTRIGDLTLESD